MLSRKKSRRLTLVLLVSFLVSLFPYFPSAQAALTPLQQCLSDYATVTPPPGFPKCSDNTDAKRVQPFSQWLFDKLNIIAYVRPVGGKTNPKGQPDMLSIPENNLANAFKAGWQGQAPDYTWHKTGTSGESPPKHPTFVDDDGVKGEYRYYGYDRLGALYSNAYFPNDATVTDPDTRKWLFRPWLSTSRAQEAKNAVSSISPMLVQRYNNNTQNIYNASGPEQLAVKNIIKSNSVTIQKSFNNEDTKKNFNYFDYMYVEQDPKSYAEGLGRMWHVGSDNNVWYQTFPLPKLNKEVLSTKSEPAFADKKQATKLNILGKSPKIMLDLKGTLQDGIAYDGVDDRFDRARYYNREDVEETTLKLEVAYPGHTQSVVGTWSSKKSNDNVILSSGQQVAQKKNVSVPLDLSNAQKGDKITFYLTTTTYFRSDASVKPKVTNIATIGMTLDDTIIPTHTVPDQPDSLPDPLVCKPNVPLHGFDIVPYPASDGTDMSRVSDRQVFIDGVKVDDSLFFSGGYVFGDEADGLHRVDIVWLPKASKNSAGETGCSSSNPVLIHDTKPRAGFKMGGAFKENRKMTVDEDVAPSNDPYVLNVYPIVSYDWSWEAVGTSSLSDQRIKVDGNTHKEFLFKKTGDYKLKLTVTNSLGRTSDLYSQDFSVLEDFAPAVIMTPYSSEIARGESVPLYYDAVSTDGDVITNQHFDVYYDSAGNETYATKVDSFDSPITAYTPKTNKLGKYRIVATVDEDFGEETFPEFITAADKRQKKTQFEFLVNNYIPYADLYTDIPTIRPEVDTFFLLDKNLNQDKIDYVKGNHVTINNQLRNEGIDPTVNSWDMHTYTYPQAASTYTDTGTSYPPSTYYYCSNGYCGTLNLTSASDNGNYHDFGTDHNETQSKSVTGTCGNTQNVKYDSKGKGSTTFTGSCGSTQPYSDGEGYSGTMSRGDTLPHGGCSDTGPPNGSCSTSYTAYYSGTASRTVSVHVPDMKWVASWRGYYAGTIYKDVRQPLTNPYTRTTSDKYIIYYSDDKMSEVADFNAARSFSDAKVILVGSTAIKSQVSKVDYFIENKGQSAEAVVKEIVDYIASKTPPTAAQIVQVNQTFKMLTEDLDPESDPIVKRETMYYHNENYFDNPMGHAAFALKEGDPETWTAETLRTSFALPGEYPVFRRIKDQPSTDPLLAKYSYYSNVAKTTIVVHRKPFAKATLDWTYNLDCSCYLTTWVDKSYDLDHNISDPINKGIIERKVRYKKDGGEWIYAIPDQLDFGSYDLEYVVRDKELAWSDPFVMSFVLSAAPSIQMNAKARTELPDFSLSSIPASEQLRVYDIWTRYPYSHTLQVALYQGGVQKTPPVNVGYYTGTKTGEDINWNDIVYTIPDTTPDGPYQLRLTAIGQAGQQNYIEFPVVVNTPINLVPKMPDPMVSTLTNDIKASTTKYPSTTTVQIFVGTPYQTTLLPMTGTKTGNIKDWLKAYIPPVIPEGTYTARFISTTPAGKSETKDVTFKLIPAQNFAIIAVVPRPPLEVVQKKPPLSMFIAGKYGPATFPVDVIAQKTIGSGAESVQIKLTRTGYGKTWTETKTVLVGPAQQTITFTVPNVTDKDIRDWQAANGKKQTLYDSFKFTAELTYFNTEVTLADNKGSAQFRTAEFGRSQLTE
ncbi:Athe_2463 domain-containing protein [Cohnella soli]|uniref:Athe_2463 domain-containing protein n=1 Tax=Cohnella soli TaxID=425005 RepID=A0ABW0HNY6_9BACL